MVQTSTPSCCQHSRKNMVSQLQEIKPGNAIGKRAHFSYIWAACERCGKTRWVALLHGKPMNHLCRSCAHKTAHYKALRNIDPLMRFLRKVSIQENGCWLWEGSRNSKGYGTLSLNGRPVYAHRFIYELLKGLIPPDKETDHLCRNHLCVNLRHLEIVTHKENMLRGQSPAARSIRSGYCIKGKHPRTPENMYIDKLGYHHCRACKNERRRERRQQITKTGTREQQA